MPSLSSLEPFFVHRGVHPFHSMLSLWFPFLFLQGAALAHLDSLSPYDLVLWTDGSVPFPFGKGGSAVLANCSLCGTEATLSFSAGPVCSSFSAEASAIQQTFCWPRQQQQVCHFCSLFLVSDFCSVLSSIFRFTSISLEDLSSLSSCFIRLQWVSGHSFLPGNDAADELARRGALLSPSAVPLLLSLVSTLFSDWRRTVSSNSSTLRLPQFPTRNLCYLVTLVVFFLAFAATDTAYC